MPATTSTTPEALLAITLRDWRAHRSEIAQAYEGRDYALTRVLEENEIGYLTDIADAAGAVMADS